MQIKKILPLLLIGALTLAMTRPSGTLRMGLLKYNGGGDWYANPTALPNLANFCNETLGTDFRLDYGTVEVGSADLFNYPFVHMTGHGNVVFNAQEAENLRNYLIGGGFLHIDDNYGMDPYVRTAMKLVFPELEFIELPFDHPVYHQRYNFNRGLPKIHEHDGGSPRGYGLFWQDRMITFYSFESDLGDGWEDAAVHNDPPEIRAAALQMGANIVQYAFEQ